MPRSVLIVLSVVAAGAALSAASGSAPMSTITIDIDTTAVRHAMKGGIGASFHAIDTPIEGHAGSAWGGNPDPADDRRWSELLAHADWLGLDWCRVEIEQRMYEPGRGRFDWENRDMRALYRILDWAQANGVEVFLQQMWQNVRWNAYPEFQSRQELWLKSAPVDLGAFAEGYAEMAEHLVKRRGYTAIKWFAITNEPGWEWSWWLVPPKTPASITPALAAVRAALDRRDIAVPLSGPDWTDLPALYPANIDYDESIGAYDVHSYLARFDWAAGEGYPLGEGMNRLRDWINWAHAKGKPLFLSEVGSMVYGWGKSDPGPGSYESALKDATLIARALNLGVDAVNRWSFTNRGNLDGQWQLVDTWDRDRNVLLERITPHPNAYYAIGLFSRFAAQHSSVLESSVQGAAIDGHRRVEAVALRSRSGDVTVVVVNNAPRAFTGELRLAGNSRPLYRYGITAAERDRADLELMPSPVGPGADLGAGRFAIDVPALSVTTYSTYRLAHGDRGIRRED